MNRDDNIMCKLMEYSKTNAKSEAYNNQCLHQELESDLTMYPKVQKSKTQYQQNKRRKKFEEDINWNQRNEKSGMRLFLKINKIDTELVQLTNKKR